MYKYLCSVLCEWGEREKYYWKRVLWLLLVLISSHISIKTHCGLFSNVIFNNRHDHLTQNLMWDFPVVMFSLLSFELYRTERAVINAQHNLTRISKIFFIFIFIFLWSDFNCRLSYWLSVCNCIHILWNSKKNEFH